MFDDRFLPLRYTPIWASTPCNPRLCQASSAIQTPPKASEVPTSQLEGTISSFWSSLDVRYLHWILHIDTRTTWTLSSSKTASTVGHPTEKHNCLSSIDSRMCDWKSFIYPTGRNPQDQTAHFTCKTTAAKLLIAHHSGYQQGSF